MRGLTGLAALYNQSMCCASCSLDCSLTPHWPSMYCVQFGEGHWELGFGAWVYFTGHHLPVAIGACSPVTVPLAVEAGGVSAGSRPSGAIDQTLVSGSLSLRDIDLVDYFPDEGSGTETEGGFSFTGGGNNSLGWTKEFIAEDGTPYLSVSMSYDDGQFHAFYNVNLTTGDSEPWAPAPQSVYFDLNGTGANEPFNTIHNRAVGLDATIFFNSFGTIKNAYYLNTNQATRIHTDDNWIRDDDRQHSNWDHSDAAYESYDEGDRNLFATACINSAPFILTHNPWNGNVYRVKWESITSNGHTPTPSDGLPWELDSIELQALLCNAGAGTKNLWSYHRRDGREVFLCATSSDGNLQATHYYDTATGFQSIHPDDVDAERWPSFIHTGPDGETVYGSQSFIRRLGENGWLLESSETSGVAYVHDTSFAVRAVFNISSDCNGYVVHGFKGGFPPALRDNERPGLAAEIARYQISLIELNFEGDPVVQEASDLNEPDTVEAYYGVVGDIDEDRPWCDWTISRDGTKFMPHRYAPDDTIYTSYDRVLTQVPLYGGVIDSARTDYDYQWITPQGSATASVGDGRHGGAGRPCISWGTNGNVVV